MAQDRLTPLDASFLHLENSSSHMHVACVMIFDGDPPPYEEFVQRIEQRLHLVPRYRQKLAEVPLGQGRPVWVDDPSFDARWHIRVSALPRPGTEYELQVLAGRVFSQQLTRHKPLWEVWLVEGLEGNRFAVLSKTHHALVDGISGLDILSVLFSEDDKGEDASRWRAQPTPSSLELLAGALWERATRPAELWRPARALLRRPRSVVRSVVETAVGLGAMAWAGLQPAPQTPYNRSAVGPDRRFVWVRGSLAEVKEIKNSMGGTVNDVMLTIVTRALRRHLLRRGENVDGMVLKAFVPVSVRSEDQRGTLGNQVSGLVAPLPVSCSNPATCLRQISEAMGGLKESGQAVGAQALTELSGFAPPTLLSQASRLITTQRFINLVVTNVPGPQFELSFDGRALKDIFPMVPLGTNLGLGVAILSYNGTINFGLVGDFDLLDDIEDLAQDFSAAIQEVADAAGVSRSASTGAADSATVSANGNGHHPESLNGGPSPSESRRTREAESPPATPATEDPGPAAASEEPSPGSAASSAGHGASSDPETTDRAPDPLSGDEGHVNEGATLVAESADAGAEDGAGAQVRVQEPWPGYARMRASEIVDRLRAADDELVGVVSLYEGLHKGRKQVLDAAQRALRTSS